MAGEFALVGGDEFRPDCEDMDREVMRASGQDPARVLIIPTAAAAGAAKAANDGVTHFGNLGAGADRLMVLNKSQAYDSGLVSQIQTAGVVYFTGGSPDLLLDTLKESLLLDSILEAVRGGAVLAGSSAGAMVMGSMMRRPGGGDWVEALGIVPGIAVLPHHEMSDPSQISRQLRGQVPAGLTVLGIDAQTGCLGRPGSWRVVGSGNVTLYHGSDWQVCRSGDRLPPGV